MVNMKSLSILLLRLHRHLMAANRILHQTALLENYLSGKDLTIVTNICGLLYSTFILSMFNRQVFV